MTSDRGRVWWGILVDDGGGGSQIRTGETNGVGKMEPDTMAILLM